MKKLLFSLCLSMLLAAPLAANAASFDFNKATADEMVAACKTEGVTLDPALAAAIVAARATTPITSEDALSKVPGMTPQIIMQLSPVDDGGVLMFDPSSQPGMKGY